MLEKAKRVKYLRMLEKVSNRFALALKKDNFNKEIFQSNIENNLKLLRKCEPVHLDSEYSKCLLEFVNMCCFGELNKEDLISKYNKLSKIKNQNQYKKEKHKHKIFDNY